jgi:hypothetical protein
MQNFVPIILARGEKEGPGAPMVAISAMTVVFFKPPKSYYLKSISAILHPSERVSIMARNSHFWGFTKHP